MSIFIAMPTMHDLELEPTILDALNKAHKPEDIYFGIRELTSQESNLKSLENRYGNKIRYTISNIDEHNRLDLIGVGKGRQAVANLYDGEDYILSIDSHTLFSDGWDTTLINLYGKAIYETNNVKTIITAYPAKYSYETGSREFKDKTNLYPYIGFDEEVDLISHKFLKIPLYKVSPPWMCKPFVDTAKELIPATKFAYNFSFSGLNFFDDEDPELVMMEEDMCKTLKLLDDGWELVYPNLDYPILGHLYVTEISELGGGRASWRDFVNNEEQEMLEQREAENMWRYIEKYRDTAQRYEKWVQCRFNSEDKHNMYIPESWFYDSPLGT